MENRLSGNKTSTKPMLVSCPWDTKEKQNNVGESILVPMSSIATNLSQLVNVYR